MTIRLRITLLITLMFVALALIGGYAINQFIKSTAEVKAVTDGVFPSTLAAADLVTKLKDVQLATVIIANASDASLVRQAGESLSAKKELLKDALKLQGANVGDARQRGLLDQAADSLTSYFASIDETVNFKQVGKNELAQANLFGNVEQYQGELQQIVETLRVEKNRGKDDAISVLNGNLTRTTMTIAAVTVIAIIVLTSIGIVLYRRITGPIVRMQAMMSEIASNQDFTRRLPVDSQDEIGQSIMAFNGMIARIETSTTLLGQRTADIQAMLQNMPQGILTVGDDNAIHPEYSAYLETIFETKTIAGRDLMQLVFDESDLGADTLSQIDAAVRACIGEDVMNFAFNEHLLVGEIRRRMSDGREKILDLGWSAIANDSGTVLRLMVCVRDVTELRQLAAQAGQQKRTLEIIGEILAVTQEKFHEFIVGAVKFVNANEVLIRENAQANPDAISELFRNMHTIKGNARTYGLRHVTDVVHEAEQAYDALRHPRPDIAWDQAMLLAQLHEVRTIIESYAEINETSLGRKGPGRRGSVERYLLVEKDHIRHALQRLETVNAGNLHELQSAHQEVRHTLRLLGTETIGETLASVLDSLPSLAHELDKAAPVVKIDDGGWRLRSQAGAVVKNVFMHLLRNAIDHGIETIEVRQSQGKPSAGEIRLLLGSANGAMQIALSDDGRGLALGKIRQTAIEQGLIVDGVPISDDDTARLIFAAGFTTAATVTEISGRGVGMDAVRDFVTREHGKIDIVFTDDRIGAAYRQFKTIVTLPENLAVHGGASIDPLDPMAVDGAKALRDASRTGPILAVPV